MVSMFPLNPETRLTRQKLAEALSEAGYPTKSATLATKATRGGGPPYELYGKRPIYTWGTSLEWAKSRLTPPRRNSSEHRMMSVVAPTDAISKFDSFATAKVDES